MVVRSVIYEDGGGSRAGRKPGGCRTLVPRIYDDRVGHPVPGQRHPPGVALGRGYIGQHHDLHADTRKPAQCFRRTRHRRYVLRALGEERLQEGENLRLVQYCAIRCPADIPGQAEGRPVERIAAFLDVVHEGFDEAKQHLVRIGNQQRAAELDPGRFQLGQGGRRQSVHIRLPFRRSPIWSARRRTPSR